MAIETVFWPRTMTTGAFRDVSVVMSPDGVGVFASLVSSCALCALMFNGRSLVVGPAVRSICAMCRAVLWGQFSYALFALGNAQGVPSPGLPYWVAFTIAELYVSYRAMIDVRRYL